MTARVEIGDLKAAVAMCEVEFLDRRQAVAVAVGFRSVKGEITDELCVKAFVRNKRPAAEVPPGCLLPNRLQLQSGQVVAVDVEEMEPPWSPPCAGARAFPTCPLQQRTRPAIGGVSVAHYAFDVGTMTVAVQDRSHPGPHYILSNNHVLALLNDACIGDPIVQPARRDGGVYPRDAIATLSRFVPIRFDAGASNLVDAAVGCALPHDVGSTVYGVGSPRAVARRDTIRVGERVRKVGRTTGVTEGTIVGIHATCDINYTHAGFPNRVTRFREQILTSQQSGYGDSGSILLDTHDNAFGLLFGGSYTHTIFNYMELVQEQLGIIVADQLI